MKNSTIARMEIIDAAQSIELHVVAAAYEYLTYRGQRRGQALMNALRNHVPELYTIITGTAADCFYNDDVIPQTLQELGFKLPYTRKILGL